jgi:hypothetical protein
MSREPDVEGWILVAVALVGLLAGWLIAFHGWNENVMRAAAYTVGIFVLLAMALRPAWHRLRLWVDLAISLAPHGALFRHHGFQPTLAAYSSAPLAAISRLGFGPE